MTLGEPLPLLASVSARGGYEVVVSRANRDRAPAPSAQSYKPLPDGPDLFRSVHVIEDDAGRLG